MLLDLEKLIALLQSNEHSEQLSDLSYPFAWYAKAEPLLWFDAQAIYPKCYWQSRDGTEEVLSLGKITDFFDESLAEASLKGEQRLWGGRAFSSGKKKHSSYFFLPALELVRKQTQWFLRINSNVQEASIQKILSSLIFKPLFPYSLQQQALSLKHQPSFLQWKTLLKKTLEQIEQTSLQKVVLARKTMLRLSSPMSAAALLFESRKVNQNHYHFLLAINDKESFVGSSPERLFKRDGNELITEALAGTTERGKTQEQNQKQIEWLLHDAKSIYENQLVVDDILQRLAECGALVQVASLEISELRNIMHLKRRIKAQIHSENNKGLNQLLLNALQPTAAIAGLPRQEAMAFIEQHEPFTRGWYSGCIGFMQATKSEFSVAIRSALVRHKSICLYAGAGIVPGSIASAEWAELNKKVATLLDLFSDPLME